MFFSIKCRTPEIPAKARIDTDGDDDEVDEGDTGDEEEDQKEKNNVVESRGSACTAGKGRKGDADHKLCTVQRVESNRKEIV